MGGWAPRALEDSVRPRRPSGASARPFNFTVRERVLTTLDKLLWLLFTVVCIMGGLLGGLLTLLYVDPMLPSDLAQLDARQNVSLVGALVCLGGMVLGYALAVIAFGFISRRFASAATHQRWVEFLDDPTAPGRFRYAGLAKLIVLALIPKERRALSNNRWSGP